MVQSVNSPNISIEPNPIGGSQTNSLKVTENQTAQFETSVQKLQENFLNDAKLFKSSRTVRSFGDIFTANMSGKRLGRIAQFFTNIGLYFTTPEKLLHNAEKNIDALQQLLHRKQTTAKKSHHQRSKPLLTAFKKLTKLFKRLKAIKLFRQISDRIFKICTERIFSKSVDTTFWEPSPIALLLPKN